MWFLMSFFLLWGPIMWVVWHFILKPVAEAMSKKHIDDLVTLGVVGSVLVAMIVGLVFTHGYLFFEWGEPVPEGISFLPSWEVTRNEFYESGEKDGVEYITFADNAGGRIEFRVDNVDYPKQEKLEWKITVTNEAGESKELEESSLRVDSYYVFLRGMKVDLFKGVNRVSVAARNGRGEATKELVINKLSVSEECEKDENKGREICKEKKSNAKASSSGASNTGDSGDKKEDKPKVEQAGSNDSNKSGEAASECTHYEFSKCWDEIEEQAYDDGYLDALYGSGHIRYVGCSGVCADIYDDAYYEGYYDGENGL